MRKVIRKWFFAWDFDKEEKWLNEMSAIGLNLIGVGFCKYIFEEGNPGEYKFRLELLKRRPANPESEQYIRFVEDTGAEFVGSCMRWAFFRKKAADGDFDLFSDIDSRVHHLNRILTLFGVVFAVEFINTGNQILRIVNDRTGDGADLFVLIISGVIAILLAYGFLHIYIRKRSLQKERSVRE